MSVRSQLQAVTKYSTSSPIRLQVVHAPGGQLDLSWNQSAPQFSVARGAKMTIVDGPVNRELSLDNLQLRSGKVTYFPHGSDVQFRLEVYLGDDHSVAESVHFGSPQLGATRSEPVLASISAEAARVPGPSHTSQNARTRSRQLKAPYPIPARQPKPRDEIRSSSPATEIPQQVVEQRYAALEVPVLTPKPPASFDLTLPGPVESPKKVEVVRQMSRPTLAAFTCVVALMVVVSSACLLTHGSAAGTVLLAAVTLGLLLSAAAAFRPRRGVGSGGGAR